MIQHGQTNEDVTRDGSWPTCPTYAHFHSEIISGPGGRQIFAEDPACNPIELFEG